MYNNDNRYIIYDNIDRKDKDEGDQDDEELEPD
jgi:hypothetical protein